MRRLSQGLARWDPIRIACVGFGLATALVVAAYIVSVATSQPTVAGAVAAVAVVAIAGVGLLYAWRLGAGGLVD